MQRLSLDRAQEPPWALFLIKSLSPLSLARSLARSLSLALSLLFSIFLSQPAFSASSAEPPLEPRVSPTHIGLVVFSFFVLVLRVCGLAMGTYTCQGSWTLWGRVGGRE